MDQYFIPFDDQITFHCKNIPHFIYPFIPHGHLGCFQFLATMNNAAVNFSAHCGHTLPVLLGMPMSRIAGSYGSSLFHMLRNA